MFRRRSLSLFSVRVFHNLHIAVVPGVDVDNACLLLFPNSVKIPLLRAVVGQRVKVVGELVGHQVATVSQRGDLAHAEVADVAHELAAAGLVGDVPDLEPVDHDAAT